MWSRRRFLEIVSGLPLVGGFVEATTVSAAAAAPRSTRDYFRELGVRPFINAAGTYTAMTASLMPPEVVEAITLRFQALRDARRGARQSRGAHRHAAAL